MLYRGEFETGENILCAVCKVIAAICKGLCASCYGKSEYLADPEKFKTRSRNNSRRPEVKIRARQRKLDNPALDLFYGAKKRSKQTGILFDIDMDDVIIPERCPILGVPLKNHRGSPGPGPDSPTIDRIIPDKGYTKGNIQIISLRANIMKSDATPTQLRLFAKWVLESHPEPLDEV